MFGTPFPWIEKFIDSVQHLKKYGWYWQIYTPNLLNSRVGGNVEIISMNIDQFNYLVNQKTGVTPGVMITKSGIPTVHMTDFMVAYGKIFEDYLKKFDFWGMMAGPDILFGRLDHFLPDSYLKDCDIFTDDPKFIDGCFTLFRNKIGINKLYEQIPNWKEAFTSKACRGCLFSDGTQKFPHTLAGTDEYGLTEVMKTSKLRYKHPKWFPLHGHDRLANHEIELKEDGSLWELNKDTPPNWTNAIPVFGREILFYHFMLGKKWPI
jgi:hypothetical protein